MDRRKQRGRVPDGSRGLDNVLHFFISDEEQAEARERAAARRAAEASSESPSEPSYESEGEFEEDLEPDEPEAEPEPVARLVHAQRGARWCIVASPNRVLDGSLAVDIAATLARFGAKTRILASFEPSPLLPESASVDWECRPELAQGSSALRIELESLRRSENLLVILPPAAVATGLRGLRTDVFDGVLLPVDACAPGLTRALDWLRRIGAELQNMRLGVVLVGAREDADANLLFRKLIGAAQRQHGLEVERLGTLCRDPSFDRSLLLGRALADLEAGGEASESLAAICEKLR